MKTKLIYFSLILLLISISCNNTEHPKPKKFFEREEMINFLVDLNLAEGTRAQARAFSNKKDLHLLTINQFYKLVFEKYNISEAEFDSINNYYVKDPELYQEIYKEVLDSLNKLQGIEKDAQKQIQKKKRDEQEILIKEREKERELDVEHKRRKDIELEKERIRESEIN